jgi:hypothetical protein
MNKPFLFLRRNVSSLTPNCSRRNLSLAIAIVAIGSGFLIFSKAQKPDTTGDIIDGWDFTGFTPEAKQSALSMLYPKTYAEWAQTATPEQIQAAARSALAITNPVLYAQLYPVYKDPAQIAKLAKDVYAITHPIEWKALQDSRKSKAQRALEALSMWAITHPDQYAALVNPFKTAEDWAAEQRELESLRNLKTYPPRFYPPAPPQEERPF